MRMIGIQQRPTVILALALCFFAVTTAQEPPQYAGKVLSVQGQVDIAAPDQPLDDCLGTSSWNPASADQGLLEGMQIRTGQRSRAVILLADGSTQKLNSNTCMQLTRIQEPSGFLDGLFISISNAKETILDLFRGEVSVRSKRKPANLKVQTRSVAAAIRGTEINLATAQDGETLLEVVEGSVDFANAQGAIVVNAGEQGRAILGQAPTKSVLVNPRDAVQWTLNYTASVSPRDFPFRHSSVQRAEADLSGTQDPLERARLLHDAGRLDDSLSQLASLSSPEASEVRAWVYLTLDRIDEALSEFGQAPQTSERVRLGLSLSRYRRGELAQAFASVEDPGSSGPLKVQRALLDLLVGEVATARRTLESVPSSDRSYPMAQGLLSNVLITQNEGDRALEAAQRALTANPDSPSAHLSLSRVQQSRFDLPGARGSVETALALDKDFLQARLQLAELLFGEGATGRAEIIVREAEQRDPNNPQILSLKGFILLARARTAEAGEAFQQALRLDAASSRAHLGLGLVAMRRGEEDSAILRILEATILDPRISLYQSYLGKALYETRAFERAIAALELAKDLDPNDPTPHLYEGIFWNDLNQPGLAVQDFRESIRLNDNRAVYRSRFLLDEDRATRNVQLATAYNRLGLTDWANLEAIRSILDNSADSSARRFLADTFLNLKGRTLAAGSELLWTRLLLPVNVNSFNSFNDYTTLFELPRLNMTAEGSYGSFDSSTGTLIASGGASRFAFSAVFDYARTAGFRPVNDFEQAYTGTALFKYAITPENGLLLSYGYQQTNQGDPNADPLVTEITNQDLRVFSHLQRAEVGYHHRFRQGSELVAVFSGSEVRGVIDDDNFPLPFVEDGARRISGRNPNLNFQAAHLLQFEQIPQFRFKYGVDYFDGRSRERVLLNFTVPSDPPQAVVQEFGVERKEFRFLTAFVQTDYEITPRFILTLGLNYDWANDDNLFDDNAEELAGRDPQNSTSRWNPQGGFFFNPWDPTVFRFSAARLLQTHQQESLVPSQIDGFALEQNDITLTQTNAFNFGWDQTLGTNSFLRATADYRDNSTPYFGRRTDGTLGSYDFDGKSYGGEVVWNLLLNEDLTLVSRYSLEHSEDLDVSRGRRYVRHDQEVSWGLTYFHPTGFSARVAENYFNQHGRLIRPVEASVWTTDLSLEYQFRFRRAVLAFEARNLFDQRYEFLANPLELDPRIPRRTLRGVLRVNF